MMPHALRPAAMRALRVCLTLACLTLGLATLADGVSAATRPTAPTSGANNPAVTRGPVTDEPVVRPHDADEDPHKKLTEPPATPTGVTAEPGRVDGEVKLSWDAPASTDDIEHHDYRYHTGGRWSAWITIPASGSSSDHVGYVNGLTGGLAYTFEVRAINTEDSPGLPSAPVSAIPPGGEPAVTVELRSLAQAAVTLALSPSSISEDGEVSTVTASLDSEVATALTVTVSAEAVAPVVAEDFTLSANRTLTIAAGALTSTGTVTITAHDNTEDTADKEVTVSGTVAGATDVIDPSDVRLTITDDDATICTDGRAGGNLCSNVDLLSQLGMNDIGGGFGNDIWGWEDSSTSKEYAIMGRSTGTAFVDISDPIRPIYLGTLPPHEVGSQLRDMKVYQNHAFIVSEADDSGLQVFDLTRLRTVSSPPVTFSETAHYSGFSTAHNVAINEDSGFAYAVGTDTCHGALHMVNIQNPASPTSAGCFSESNYIHDAQCVNYVGPDPDHSAAEICFNSNVSVLTIVDVTDKAAPETLSRTGYPNRGYAHQGWLTDDHAYFLLGDELDEYRVHGVVGTTTLLFDVSDLDSPTFIGAHVSTTRAIDHNQYIKGKYTYQSNYTAGLRILDITDVANGNLTEVAFFDMEPDSDSSRAFLGTWSNYPFFDSGTVIVSDRRNGLFVLRPNLVDSIQPKLARATVVGETLKLTYGEALDGTSTPAISAFAVTVQDAARTVSHVSVDGTAVALTLAPAVAPGEEVTVTYTAPETSPIRDEAENKAPSFSSRAVTNDTTAPPATPEAPTVTAASATSLTVTWEEPPQANPPITDYNVQYRVGNSGDFTDWEHDGTALTATLTGLTEGEAHEVQVQAVNAEGMSGWSLSGSGTPAPLPNNPPMVSATATTSTTVNGLGTVGLLGTASDQDGDTLTYAWTSSGGGGFAAPAALETTWTAPEKDHAAQHIVLTLTVTDDGTGELTSTAEVSVTVRENQRPTASVSADIAEVAGGGTVLLEGEASDDDTAVLTYAWTSESRGSFSDDSTIETTWTAPPKAKEQQDVTITLTVTDDGHLERAAIATANVMVRANQPPTASATGTPGSVYGGGTVELEGTASDDDDTLTYKWTSDGGGSFAGDSALKANWTAPAARVNDQDVTLTLTVTDTIGASTTATVEVRVLANQAPEVTASPTTARVEGGGTVTLGSTVRDPEGDGLTYTWSSNGGGAFANASTLDTTWTAPAATDAAQSIILTLTVTDDGAGARAGTATVSITVREQDNSAPMVSATISAPTVYGRGGVDVGGKASDPDGDNLTYAWTSNGGGSFAGEFALHTRWMAPAATDADQDVTLTLTVTDTTGASGTSAVGVRVLPNQAPEVTASPASATVAGGGTVDLRGSTATDPEGDTLTYAWTSNGGGSFADDEALKTIWTAPTATAAAQTITLTLTVTDDGAGALVSTATVSTTVRDSRPRPAPIFFGGGGGGGGGGRGPTPSDIDYEWTVKQDIEELDAANDTPAGMWSDGATLWLVDNPDGPSDAVYAYDLESGERAEDREFPLDERNRAPRGIWSDGKGMVWVSDSGRNLLFAYDLATGDRLPERDIALDGRNRAARGIWCEGDTMWVLDARRNAVFAYDLEGGELLAEYAPRFSNSDPHGIWSDGVTIWISDHGLKQLWAYRLPVLPYAPPEDPQDLERARNEDFTRLSRASNNSPRGIWSDGDVMYVADGSDDRVYTYNMPDAIDARLASLTLEGVDIGEFDPGRTEYEGVIAEGVTETVVTAEAIQQRRTNVVIDPPDGDEAADGHQVTLAGLDAITVTVTSADGSRTKTYRVAFELTVTELALSPPWTSFEWPGADGATVADALREGGVSDRVLAIYEWDEATRTWLGYFPGLADVPGLNTLTTLKQGGAYWIAVTEPLTWTLETRAPHEH